MWLTKVAFLFFLIFTISQNVSSLLKLTNLKCESFNKSWIVFPECRLRAIKRDMTVANIIIDYLYPAHQIDLRIEVMKKANGYKPFLYNVTVDFCAFMKKRNNPIFRIAYDQFKDFSNVNHTCPYMGLQIIRGFHPNYELMKLPVPDGEYAAWLTWYLHSKKTFSINVYSTIEGKN